MGKGNKTLNVLFSILEMGKNRKRNYDDTTIKTPSDIKLSTPIDNRLIEKEKASSFVILFFSDY